MKKTGKLKLMRSEKFDALFIDKATGDDDLVGVLQALQKVINQERQDHERREVQLQDEADRLRTALNNLVGAIVHKKLAKGLESDLAEAKRTLSSPSA